MSDFRPVSEFVTTYDHTPHGWPGDSNSRELQRAISADIDAAMHSPDDGPPEPDDEPELPPDPDEEPPAESPEEPPDALVRIPDEVLDPEALVPAVSILARVGTLPQVVAAQARATELVAQASRIGRIVTAADRARADVLRDQNRAHEAQVEACIGKACEASNQLHKGLTGLRAWMKGDVAIAAKTLGDGIAASIRVEQEAEAARQRAERQKALDAEKARLKAEADAADLEREQLAASAALEPDPHVQADLLTAAQEKQCEAAEIRQEAATVTAPPVARQEVVAPAGSSTHDNWKALPASVETWEDMPTGDKRALILFVAERLKADDGSFIHLLDVATKACNQMAKAQKGTMKIPGIRAVNPPVYSKRAR